MMISRGLFGWSPPHIQPLTPVSEVSEPPESPSPYLESTTEAIQVDDDGGVEETEEMEPPPAAVPFLRLFACADGLDCILMIVGSLAAAAHGAALVVYLHFIGKIINLLSFQSSQENLFHEFTKVTRPRENLGGEDNNHSSQPPELNPIDFVGLFVYMSIENATGSKL